MESLSLKEELNLTKVIGGSLFFAVCAWISVYFLYVPFTMQTMGVFLLGLILGPRLSFYSLLLYLIEASIGLPVISCMRICPLWFLTPRVGYLLSFPIAAYVVGKIGYQKEEKGTILLAILAGLFVIYLFGLTGLSFFVKGKALFDLGLFIFLPGEILKIFLAFWIYFSLKRLKN